MNGCCELILNVEEPEDLTLQVDDDDLTLQMRDCICVQTRISYIHRQQSAAAVWHIEHNLKRYPSVTVVDSADSKVTGDVDYIDDCTLTVSFVAPFSGSAYLN